MSKMSDVHIWVNEVAGFLISEVGYPKDDSTVSLVSKAWSHGAISTDMSIQDAGFITQFFETKLNKEPELEA